MNVRQVLARISTRDYETLRAMAQNGKYAGNSPRVAVQRYAEDIIEHHAEMLRQAEERQNAR